LERRYIVFIALSLAIIVGSQMLQATFFPKPPEPVPGEQAGGLEKQADGEAGPESADDPDAADAAADGNTGADAADTAEPEAIESPSQDAVADASREAGVAEPPAERTRWTLGSLDADSPAGMLVTLTSRGATVERIELAGSRFHDQDDRSGYLGHLALETVPEGCRVQLVGPGTPAANAGLKVGDVVVRVAGVAVADPRGLADVLAATKPGDEIALEVLREGSPQSLAATLRWRPLEVVRPELLGRPVNDPDGGPTDPMSFVLSLERRTDAARDRRRPDESREIPGQELASVDWEAERVDDESVRFRRQLGGGLTVVKQYRLLADPAGNSEGRYRIELSVTLDADADGTKVTYALDGPTGLPTEGWWYASRISRSWGSLGVRDVAMRFAGEPSQVISSLSLTEEDAEIIGSAVLEAKPLSFAGVDALYFAAALLPDAEGEQKPLLDEVRPLVVGDYEEPALRKLTNVTSRLISRPIELTAGQPVTHRYEIFAGPKKPDLLEAFGIPGSSMSDLVYYGWFGWVARPLIAILHLLHMIVRNYGIAIILLTVIVRGAMFPISRKQALSAQKMQVLQPEMKAIAEKYKDSPEKRTRATQELWKKHNYNPASGCVLVFIQIPIFMGLYRSLATDVELRQAPLFTSAIRWCSNLAAPDMFLDWAGFMPGFLVAPQGWLGPFLNLLPLLTIGLFLWQQKLFMPPAVDEQSRVQQQVMKYMMFFMALMFFKVPCGLCLYFIASSLWGIAERIWLPVPKLAAAGGQTIDVPFSAASNGKRGGSDAGAAIKDKRALRKKKR
jgi:YidC/Oxa1 family membrane protein insertase